MSLAHNLASVKITGAIASVETTKVTYLIKIPGAFVFPPRSFKCCFSHQHIIDANIHN
jgi:hypothetical protein